MSLPGLLVEAPVLGTLLRHRFTKFGIVGFSGTIVNLLVLYTNQEILLRSIYPQERRLSYSLTIAILVATVNNFSWNRYWTW